MFQLQLHLCNVIFFLLSGFLQPAAIMARFKEADWDGSRHRHVGSCPSVNSGLQFYPSVASKAKLGEMPLKLWLVHKETRGVYLLSEEAHDYFPMFSNDLSAAMAQVSRRRGEFCL